jgi:hypothetical protein
VARESRDEFVTAQREAAVGEVFQSSVSRQGAAMSCGSSLVLLAFSFLTAVNVKTRRSWREASFTQRVTAPILIAGYLMAGAVFALLPVDWLTLWACIPLFANVETWQIFGETFSDAERTTYLTPYWLTAIGVGLVISALWTLLCAAALRRWPFVLRTLLRPNDVTKLQTTAILLIAVFGMLLFPAAAWFIPLRSFMN